MPLSPLAGQPAPEDLLIDTGRLESQYFGNKPDLGGPTQMVSFGTSGHRGTSSNGTFTESHILAITQAICEYRAAEGITGPVFLGKDTHALSGVAQQTALEVLAANGMETMIQERDGFTPTPAISHAILVYNRGRTHAPADGIVITPSHNPPADGGFKYNPPDGGPADTAVTDRIQNRANELLRDGNRDVQRIPFTSALKAATTHQQDYVRGYVDDLGNVIDMEAIRSAGLSIGVDPLGGASVAYWEPTAEKYGLKVKVVNPNVDPRFAFMSVDHDGKIRMDCSSPYAMAGLVKLKDDFDIAWGNDPDADRHGIVTRSSGLMNPNHYLAVAIGYLIGHRPEWPRIVGGWENPGQQQPDRQGSWRSGAHVVGSAGGVQVVCAGAVRRVVLLRRGRKRRGEFPAAERAGVDDGQGRADSRIAGGGDYGGNGQRSGRALQSADGEIWHFVLHANRRAGERGTEECI